MLSDRKFPTCDYEFGFPPSMGRYERLSHLCDVHDMDELTLVSAGLTERDIVEIHGVALMLRSGSVPFVASALPSSGVERLAAMIAVGEKNACALHRKMESLALENAGTPIYDRLILEEAERLLSEAAAQAEVEHEAAVEAEAKLDAAWAAEHRQLIKKNRMGLVTWLRANTPPDFLIDDLNDSCPRADLMAACEEVLYIKYAKTKESI
jgi:hypothetical protein